MKTSAADLRGMVFASVDVMRVLPSFLLSGLALTTALAFAQAGEPVTHLSQDNSMLRVEEVTTTDTAVTGRVVNLSNQRIDRIELLVSDVFLWKNDHQPGSEDPGGATKFEVPDPIPAHGSATFRIPRTLPTRPDGRFMTDVTILRFTAQEPMATTGHSETVPGETEH
jgi:hypothetical protein